MAKYIDSEELEKRVTELIADTRRKDWPIAEYYLKKVINIIDSLQQKPVEWSEEDERILRTIISDGMRGVELDSKQITWLNSLRPQPKPEVDFGKTVEFECIGKQVTMTVQQLIDYYIDTECCKCGF